jgi:hypothetical protein
MVKRPTDGFRAIDPFSRQVAKFSAVAKATQAV